MLVLLFISVKLIQSCLYSCQTCDTSQEVCSSCPATRNLSIDEKGVNVCLCKQNFVDIGGQECLKCPSYCENCDPHDPSKCISCGNKEVTHRVLDSKQACVCQQGYTEVWYTYNCLDMQFNEQILQFQYILSQEEYVNKLQNKFPYSQTTVQGLEYLIQRGIMKDDFHQFQQISTLESNKIINLTNPFEGQAYMQKFDNLFALGIMQTPGSSLAWAADLNESNYKVYKGAQMLNQSKWNFYICQFQIRQYVGNVFLQIALSENNTITNQGKNRLLETTKGNMKLCYYLAYEHGNWLLESELDQIVFDILYILFRRPSNSLDYYFNGSKIVIRQCQPNYILQNEECVCDIENGYFLYNSICQSKCPSDCVTCTKEVCLQPDHSIKCQENYYLDTENSTCLSCDQTCQICINGDECIKCKSGLILMNNECSACQEFLKQAKCDQYDKDCFCIKCIEGYKLNQLSQCIKCASNCQSCNLEDQCDICKDGYYLNDNQCVLCQENCVLCQNLNQCIKSHNGYYVENGIALQCTNNCLIFFNECQCQDCPDQYYQDHNDLFCYPCQDNCQTCSNKQTCINCVSNSFYLDNSKCTQCSFPCLTCLSQTKCLSCVNDYYYYLKEHQNCVQCPAPCITCYYDQTALCNSCIESYYLFNQQCYECPLFCKNNCNFDRINNLVQCGQCQTGFYATQLSIPFECKKCKDQCTSCTNEELCLECSQGYILNNGKCQSCSQLYSNQCISCNNLFCLKCQNGYQLTNGNCIKDLIIDVPICLVEKQYYNTISNTCESCIQNCIICNTSSTCVRCDESYYWKSQICVSCKFPCNTCLSDQFCLTISNQLYYIDDAITDLNQINSFSCKPPCKKCYSNEQCIDCVDGLYFENNNCSQCDTTCKTCKNQSSFCTSCNSGYLLLKNICYKCLDENCQNCNPFCESCNHLNDEFYKCQSCIPGYYQINQECQRCSAFCETCSSSSDQCSSCFEGYFLTTDMRCEKCNEGCKSCQVQTKSCTVCEEGYYLSEISDFIFQCLKCDQGCKSCEEGACLVCSVSYYLTEEKKCLSCVQPCLKCASLTQCTLCENGYYLNNGTCDRCQQKCLICSSSNDCLSCENSYQLVDKLCVQCSKNCIKCNNGQCQQCEQGYQLQNDGYCHQVSIICNIKQCSQCVNESQCLSCSKGYTLNTTINECQLDNQLKNSFPTDNSGNENITIIIIIVGNFSIFILLYLYKKWKDLNITIKPKQRDEPQYPELPFTLSENPC
ncbi:unnamed protein product [Paramecium octaurelia]|uniref:EGF-like domain-containing protein n=1 Tax=Paramecium octaurelia TaxID=43137 RepID=A0A8S1XQV8_PAROT|nr:unnamed protein product [Paramecium octaurelia]